MAYAAPVEDTPVHNRTFYTASSLANVDHTLVITYTGGSAYFFDSVMYSTVSASTPSVSNRPAALDGENKPSIIAPIVGGVLGGLAFLCVVAGFIWYWRCRRRKVIDGESTITFQSSRCPTLPRSTL